MIREDLPEEAKQAFHATKLAIIEHYAKGLKLADLLSQSWMLFNGAIFLWNTYLKFFKNPQNDAKLLPELLPLLRDYFDIMKKSLKEIESKQITDYVLISLRTSRPRSACSPTCPWSTRVSTKTNPNSTR